MENVKNMAMEFCEAFPDVFYKSIQTRVVTMEVLKKNVTVGTHTPCMTGKTIDSELTDSEAIDTEPTDRDY